MTVKDITGWVSISDELPKEKLYVEVCTDKFSEDRNVAYRNGRRFYNENKEEVAVKFWRHIR